MVDTPKIGSGEKGNTEKYDTGNMDGQQRRKKEKPGQNAICGRVNVVVYEGMGR